MKKKAFRAALPYTLPICVGFLLIGASYGLLMRSKGFSVWYPMAMSALIYAGSMEFVTVNLLLSAFRPLYAFLLTLWSTRATCFTASPCCRSMRGSAGSGCT